MVIFSFFNSFDQHVLEYIFSLHTPFLNNVFLVVTEAGSTEVVTILTIVFTGWLYSKKRYRDMHLTVLTVAGSTLTTNLLKMFFVRPRPQWAPYQVDTFSFPSGHATGAFALYAVAAFVLLKYASNKTLRTVIVIVALLLIGLVGFSRVYLGFHYMTDVLGGYFIGLLWLLTSVYISKRHSFKN